MKHFYRALCLVVLLAASGLAPAFGIAHPNVERGFAEDKVFAYSGIDSVNAMNGNVVLTIPIGQSYPVNGGFSYGLTLVYNSKVWDFERIDLDGSGCQPFPTMGCNYYIQALPSRRSNAGLGFRLSLGALVPPDHESNESDYLLYVAADGSEHRFHATLRPGQTPVPPSCSQKPWQCLVSYTRDGTYLRMEVKTPTLREIHFPDGAVHTFEDLAPVGNKPDWKLTSMKDSFGNTVTLTYNAAGRIQIQDPHGRSTYIRFTTVAGERVVSSVQMNSFAGPAVGYTFNYHTGSGGTPILRGCEDTDPTTSLDVNVPLLASITQPDGSRYRMTYYEDAGGPAVNCRQGAIASLEVPTLGKVEWTYQPYNIPVWGCKYREWARNTPGVASRTMRDPSGATLGTWNYATAFTLGPVDNGCGFPVQVGEELRNTVTDPNGNQVEHYFSIWSRVAASANGFVLDDYGLPFSRNATSGGHLRSMRVVEGFTPKRTTYVKYEKDSDACASVEDCTDRNRRQSASRVVFHDDANRYTQVTSSDWDGQGHFRQRVTSGTVGGSPRTERTEYFGILPSPSQKWLLNLFDAKTQAEGGATAKQEYCFDGATGFLKRMRILRLGTSRSTTDVITRYQANSLGNTTDVFHHGGDTAPVGTGSLCNVSLPNLSARYWMSHTYQAGVLASSQYRTQAGNLMSFKTLERSIHTPTGLTTWSRDTAGLQTNFTWDSMGRLSRIDGAAGHDADVEYKYFNATSASQPARVTVTTRPQAGGAALTEQEYLYDGFGRLTRSGERMPNGSWSFRTTTYDGLGQVTRVSEAHTGNPVFWTQYLNYDAFGRARTVRPADGAQHDVTYSFLGIRQVQRTVKVGTSRSGGVLTETPQTTTELYDHQGRMISVTEPAGGLTATYGYDVGGRLASAVLRPTGVSSPTQVRSFVYDQRGFMTSETHPEKGTTTYSLFDAQGRPGRKIDGAFDLRYTYDRAERLASIEELHGGSLRLLKSFAYGSANAGANLKRGKLEKANRFNYASINGFDFEVRVRETYDYSGRGGRTSGRVSDVFINGGFSDGFTQGWAYDELGDVVTVDYPKRTCIFCVVQPRTQSFTYTRGRLTSIPGYTGTAPTATAGEGITYHPSGLVFQVAHQNGMVDTADRDPHWMARPKKHRSTGNTTPRWDSGVYKYDGAGNLASMGASEYLYDGVGRLTQAEFPITQLGGGAKKLRTYTYDPFGNLQAIGGMGGRNTPTSQTTNRLTQAVYDSSGNLTAWNAQSYAYDAFGMASRVTVGTEEWYHAYTADDERLFSYQWIGGDTNRWTVRDLGGQVLREYEYDRGDNQWSVEKDYLHRGQALHAAETSSGRRHFHLDHLGTPRLITDASKSKVAWHTYYPFGEEATADGQDDERRKFTSHERDFHDPAGSGDDVDYMHARYYSPVTGRFLRVDPAGESADPFGPQTWNRYSYVIGRPLTFVDPTGEVLFFFGLTKDLDELRRVANEGLHGVDLVIDSQGQASLTPNSEVGPPSPGQAAFAAALETAIQRPESVSIDVVSSHTQVLIGSYAGQAIDIADIAVLGNGRVINSAGALAHEVVEQTARQVFQLPNNDKGFLTAHEFGLAAEAKVQGYSRGKATSASKFNPRTGTGTTVSPFTRGNEQATVTFHWVRGNLVRVQRK